MVQSPLADLRSTLARLVWIRALIRYAVATASLVLIGIGVTAVLFLVDWLFRTSVDSRRILLILGVAVIVTFAFRSLGRLWKAKETIEDVALLVERQQGIDTDLIAALQFDSATMVDWGSVELARGLIVDVAGRARSMNVFDACSFALLRRHFNVLLVAVAVLLIVAATNSRIAAVFMNRMLLGSAEYPTHTTIRSIHVNRQVVFDSPLIDVSRASVPYGDPVKIKVMCSGEPPRSVQIRLTSSGQNPAQQIDLVPSLQDRMTYYGDLRHMTESFTVVFQVGDAVSRAIPVDVVPLPIVDVSWEIVPPQYAEQASEKLAVDPSSNILFALEGSNVQCRLTCLNKSLESAKIDIGELSMELIRNEGASEKEVWWTLPPNTAFSSVKESMGYVIQVVDQDGLSLKRPIVGQLRKRPDQRPRVLSSSVTKAVLPTAEPRFDYDATDDFGIARIQAVVSVRHIDEQTVEDRVDIGATIASDRPRRQVHGQFTIPFSKYELVKGDVVKIIVEATDWRGERTGQTGVGEPLTLRVTDLAEVLSTIADEDKKAAEKLDLIIKASRGKP